MKKEALQNEALQIFVELKALWNEIWINTILQARIGQQHGGAVGSAAAGIERFILSSNLTQILETYKYIRRSSQARHWSWASECAQWWP